MKVILHDVSPAAVRYVVFLQIIVKCNTYQQNSIFQPYLSTPSRWIIDQWDFPSRQLDTHWAERCINGLSQFFGIISKHPWCDNRQSLNAVCSIDHQKWKNTRCATAPVFQVYLSVICQMLKTYWNVYSDQLHFYFYNILLDSLSSQMQLHLQMQCIN